MGHRDPCPAVVTHRQALPVLVRQTVEILLIDDELVGDLGEVLVEPDPDLDEPGHRLVDLRPCLWDQIVAGLADIASLARSNISSSPVSAPASSVEASSFTATAICGSNGWSTTHPARDVPWRRAQRRAHRGPSARSP